MESSSLEITTTNSFVSSSTLNEQNNIDHGESNKASTAQSFTNGTEHTTQDHTSADLARSSYTETFILIWIDPRINESNDDRQNFITKLLRIVNSVKTFTDVEQSIDFIRSIEDKDIFLILSNDLIEQVVPRIEDLAQLRSVYVFCDDKPQDGHRAKEFKKLKGVFTQVESISHVLRQDIRHSNDVLVPISTITASCAIDLNELDQSFMYSQLLKEIFLEMPPDENARKNFIDFCRTSYITNSNDMQELEEFERDYHQQSPIWWYTRYYLLYSMLNQALRCQDTNTVLKMGFFLRDLHHQIERIHSKENTCNTLTVFRGQGMFRAAFERLKQSKGGLLSFNNFLSTSRNCAVAYNYAESARENHALVGVVFQIKIDPSISSTPFASIDDISFFNETERETLFSMNTVFRIMEIEQISDRLWFVTLTLIDDKDHQLTILAEYVRQETAGPTGINRLTQLLTKMGEFDKAEEIVRMIINTSDDKHENLVINNLLGYINQEKGNLTKALSCYNEILTIQQNSLPSDDPEMATTYNNIGEVFRLMGEYSAAFSNFQKTLEIRQMRLPENHPDLLSIYNNIGLTYHTVGQYSTALTYYEKTLKIQETSLPSNHPVLATIYNNIALTHNAMGEYATALLCYEKALSIQRKSLPPNHSSVVSTYNNIGLTHHTMGQYSLALPFYEKALEIVEKSLPPDHSDLALLYNNIGELYRMMGDYDDTWSYYDKALEIEKKSLSPDHPRLADTYSNMGSMAAEMGDECDALSNFEKALEIRQKSLPPNHPTLAVTYNNIGSVYSSMGEYSTALSYYEKVMEAESVPLDHPSMATTYNNIGEVHQSMKQYSTAMSYYLKALAIEQKSLPSNHPNLANTCHNIASLQNVTGEYASALSNYKKALDIRQQYLPSDHPTLETNYYNIAKVLENLCRYEEAVKHAEQAVDIAREGFGPQHSNVKENQEYLDYLRQKL